MVASCGDRGSSMAMGGHSELNSSSLRKMLRPVHTAPDSPVTSPENTRGQAKVKNEISCVQCRKSRHSFFSFLQTAAAGATKKGQMMVPHRRMEKSNSSGGGCMSEPEFFDASNQQGRPSKARSEQRIVINGYNYGNQVRAKRESILLLVQGVAKVYVIFFFQGLVTHLGRRRHL